jgi:acyl-CoA reductase-like NAD-dependent aldehyde dehydrogenase
MSTERIIVVKSVVDQLIKNIRSVLQNFPARCDMVSDKAANRTLALIDDALGKGAVLQTGTRDDLLRGASMATTVISNLTPNMDLFTTESFGSCVGIIEVDDASAAVDVANGSFYGLSASIFTKDIGRAIAIGKRLQSGAVHINSLTLHDEATLPHGGVKDSGYGRFGGRWGISEFVQTKTILVHGIKM